MFSPLALLFFKVLICVRGDWAPTSRGLIFGDWKVTDRRLWDLKSPDIEARLWLVCNPPGAVAGTVLTYDKRNEFRRVFWRNVGHFDDSNASLVPRLYDRACVPDTSGPKRFLVEMLLGRLRDKAIVWRRCFNFNDSNVLRHGFWPSEESELGSGGVCTRGGALFRYELESSCWYKL